MRFLKLTGKDGDILHVWIEDDCPFYIVQSIRAIMKKQIFTYTERRYERNDIEK